MVKKLIAIGSLDASGFLVLPPEVEMIGESESNTDNISYTSICIDILKRIAMKFGFWIFYEDIYI